MKETTAPRKVGFFNYLAYGAADLYGGGAFFIVTTFSMFYLVNVVGMHPFLAGLIPALGKIWDAINDPLMGYISDNTPENRFGKRRVWFLVSVLPVAATFILIWFPTNIASQFGKFFFYMFAYIFFFTVTTMSYVPYAALAAEMTNDPKERNKLTGSRIFFSFVATLLGGLIAKPIIDKFDGGKTGYLIMGIIFGIIFAIPWIFIYFGTWELKQPVREKDKTHFLKNFLSLFKNKSCRIHIVMYVCSYGTLDIIMAWLLFYFVDYLNMDSQVALGFMTIGKFTLLQGGLLITMMAAIPFYVYVSGKKGHAVSYIIGLTVVAVGMIFMAFQTPQSPFWLLMINIVILGFGISAGSLIPHQLMPFVVDVDKVLTGKDRAGTYSSAMTLTRKLFLGLIIMNGLGLVLSGIGYKQPVATVLKEDQYNSAVELISSDSELIETAYVYNAESGFYILVDKKKEALSLAETAFKGDSSIPKNLSSLSVSEYAALVDKIDSVKEERMTLFKDSFQKLSDDNYHLNYYKYDSVALVEKKLDDSQKDLLAGSSLETVPAAVFEDVLGKYDQTSISGLRKYSALVGSYSKEGDSYVYDATGAEFIDREDVSDIRVLFNDIGFKYSGIGDTQKISQSLTTVKWIRILFIIFPLIMTITGIITAFFFKLTPVNHKVVVAELERLNNGGKKEDADENTKAVCEMLTGYKYE